MGIELRHIGEDEFKPLVRLSGLASGCKWMKTRLPP